jgi:protein neuralized
LGFTSHNPTTIQSLPKYACPDLTGKPGYWAKALAERYAESNALIHYYFTPNGDVHFGVNGRDKGIFFSGVDTRQPLWCLIDLYGNCTAIELVDMRRSLNNFARSDEGGGAAGAGVEEVTPIDTADVSSEQDNVANSLDALTLDGANINELEMPLRFNSSARFRDLKFHTVTGTGTYNFL